jgi:YD repeat-containing protein
MILRHLSEGADDSAESFTYNALGQVLTHTDGKGQTTRLLRTARGLPSSRQDAMGRKSWQFASRLPAEKLSRLHNLGSQP